MIYCGIDAVEIERFSTWHAFSRAKLLRIFTSAEIDYCLKEPKKSAERYAVRFAAKEAFFKAIASVWNQPMPFLAMCKYVEVTQTEQGRPIILAQWVTLPIPQNYCAQISLTHTSTTAIAIVLLQQQCD